MRFLAIGATGQQGGAVVDALLSRGARVRAIVRNPDKARDLSAYEALEISVAELEDAAALTGAFEGVAAVFAMTTMTGPQGTTSRAPTLVQPPPAPCSIRERYPARRGDRWRRAHPGENGRHARAPSRAPGTL